jgi:prephenate dehydratase
MPSVAIEGIQGSFHDLAAQELFGPEAAIVDCDTFRQVFNAVNTEATEYGVVAIENRVDAHINQVYSLTREYGALYICGEYRLPIKQYLIGASSMGLNSANNPDITVESHVVALGQCERWLEDHVPLAHKQQSSDTAKSLKDIVESRDPSRLAIAGSRAIELYGGVVVAGPINDHPRNETRFRAIVKDPTPVPGANKTTIEILARDRIGTLHDITGVFKENEISMSRLYTHTDEDEQSASFSIDFLAGIETKRAESSLAMLKKLGFIVVYKGSYVAALPPKF